MKPFDRWNKVKQRLERKNIDNSFHFYEREVWWCSLGVNVGVEVDGKNHQFERPVLVSYKKIQRTYDMDFATYIKTANRKVLSSNCT